MEWFNVVVARLRALVRRDAVIDDIDDELRAHIELETEALVERGMTPEAARHTAHGNFGRIPRVRDLAYEVRGGGMLETLSQDARYGGRTLRKHPGFTAVSVLILAVGIGATAAIFTVVDAVVFRRLPFPNADRLVLIGETNARGQGDAVSPANFLDWKRDSALKRMAKRKRPPPVWTAGNAGRGCHVCSAHRLRQRRELAAGASRRAISRDSCAHSTVNSPSPTLRPWRTCSHGPWRRSASRCS